MKRFINISILLLTTWNVNAQLPGINENHITTTTMLDANASHSIETVQYFDGLGRLVEVANSGINPSGKGVYTRLGYDAVGRQNVESLPVVGNSGCAYLSSTSLNSLRTGTYSDTQINSQTTYDALGRSVFISTPGNDWEGRGKTIRYVTNSENSVKKYKATTLSPTSQGYYPAGALTGEIAIDEDSVCVTTFKDLMGRVVLERRGDNDDTYFVYADNGLLRFVLSPMYQEGNSAYYRYRYDYDNHGRLTAKYLPGCAAILYWYDSQGLLTLLRDNRLQSASRNRFFLYDRLGRLAVQGTCDPINSNLNYPVNAFRFYVQGFHEFCNTGYYVPSQFTPANPQIEIVNYYDNYSFLSTSLCSGLLDGRDFTLNNPCCAASLPTGVVTATTDGQLLLSVNYYDEEGRVIDSRESLLNGDFLKTTTDYSFTGKPLSIRQQLSSGGTDFDLTESYTYSTTTDKQLSCTISYNDASELVWSGFYNMLGLLGSEVRGNRIATSYHYDLHGWLTGISSNDRTSLTAPLFFTQDLYYATGSGTPCYNGNISSMKWKFGNSGGHGYLFTYDKRNRLTEASHTNYNMSPLPYMYSETMTYNRNSSITTLTRTGNSQAGYGNMDFLSYSYTGNRLKSITDLGSSNVHDGAFEFVNGANSALEYYYNNAGDLTRDKNKGIALIQYDLLGHPTRVQFTNGNVTEYIYAADGRKLRTKRTTAVEGLTVPMGQTMDLTAAQTLAVDTTDCSGPWMFRRRGETNVTYTDAVSYHFDGGYITFQPELVQQPLLPVMTYNYVPSYHYYLRDHLGNNRLVISDTGDIEQTNEYYPYGGPWGNASTFQGLQPFKYNGKELDRVHGLDWYDYGARRYDPAFVQFTQMDPLCEQYPHLSPYAYCAGNPVRYVDPDGRKIDLSLLDEKQQKRFKDQIDFVSNYSPLFYEMYQSLDNSNDVYYINYGSLNKEGQFQKNDKGGGTITFSSKIKDTKIPVLSEELFHAYQHDNRNRYDQGEFNREFEAKVFVHAVASDVGGISLFDNTNSFLSDIYNRKYGNDNKVITPMNVQSSHFLKSYYKFANIFADYNRKHKIGNINYRRYTTIPPYSLQTIVRNAY